MSIGAPQILVLIVLVQRIAEDLYAKRNTRLLKEKGAYEIGAQFYPIVVISHLAWLAGIFLLVPAEAQIDWWFLGAYLVLQGARYWVIGSLGRYWTMRIVTLDGAPVVRRGPYRYMRHPNYLVLVLEIAVLPLAFGAWQLALAAVAVNGPVLLWKLKLEDEALETRRETI